MELNEFLAHLNSGAPVQGGSEVHQCMHGVSQEALRITAEIQWQLPPAGGIARPLFPAHRQTGG